ncbi:MAG TPA: hypothetical protein VEU06_01600 [Micropepsaceae bacterium]|jgi:hypothetical protein|nr:hypothetical protein [Micropepsaceae bacterium]
MNMIDTVAKAIWEKDQAGLDERARVSWDARDPLGDTVRELKRKRCRDLARAAIEALIKPDVAMTCAGTKAANAGGSLSDAYAAMISAALKERVDNFF